VPSRLKDAAWRAAFARWPALPDPGEGYTLLLPVPADLPVFLRLALANAATQDRAGRVETLVVPDIPSPAFARAYREAAARFADAGPLRLVELKPAARAMRRLAGNQPGTNYFLQVHAGTAAATTTHVLFHDADLFIEDAGFMARHHRRCADEGLACLGVSPAWDDWLRDHGFGHVVATWELMVDTRWAREFEPWQHRNHSARLDGEQHVFDVTLYTQALTAPERCARHDATASFEHFNWVIGVYRHFQQARGAPFEDDRFLLLLIRLLSDALEAPGGDVPAVGELARGIEDGAAPVVYPSGERYPEFRAKLDRVLRGPLFDAAARERIEGALDPFERAFPSP
jgi:hypothetical protein